MPPPLKGRLWLHSHETVGTGVLDGPKTMEFDIFKNQHSLTKNLSSLFKKDDEKRLIPLDNGRKEEYNLIRVKIFHIF
jgi:hypothetical protein